MNKTKVLLLFLISIFSSACSYTGAIHIPDNFSMSEGKGQYALKAAVVVTPQQKNEVVNMNVDIANISLTPYPEMYKIIQEKMKRVFSTVDILEEKDFVKENYDVQINTLTKLAASSRNMFETSFAATGLETKGGNELFSMNNQQKEPFRIPVDAGAMAFLTGFTLFVASPITIPACIKSIGKYSEKTISEMLSKSLDESVESLMVNPMLKRYAEGGYKHPNIVQHLETPVKPFLPSKKKPQEELDSDVGKSDVDDLPTLKMKPQENSYAIVIGIEHYRQKLPHADFAASDAQLVSEYLSKVMGYPEENVVTLTNERAALGDFVKYFEKWLPNNAEQGSTIFVYYSGHGAPDPKNGDAYLVPYDGDPAFIEQTGYSLKRVYENLAKLPAKNIIVALDSCFSGAGGKSVSAPGSRALVRVEKANSKNMIVMTASSDDQISSTYKEKGHGVFTYFFLKGIKDTLEGNKESKLQLVALYNYLKPKVERISRRIYNTEQTPQLMFGNEGLRNIELR